jgi:hypothetical protein
MGDEQKPEKEPKGKKRDKKKLELNKETIQELSDSELGDVAGGIGGTKGGPCLERTFAPACPPAGTISNNCTTELLCPSQLTCGCPGV